MDLDRIVKTKFSWKYRYDVLAELSHKDRIRYLIFCAEKVLPFVKATDINSAQVCLEHARGYLEDIYTETQCQTIAELFRRIGVELELYGIYSIIFGAVYTTCTVSSASYAEVFSKRVHDEFADPELAKQEQMNFLKELVFNNLSEEEKQNWLLVASL